MTKITTDELREQLDSFYQTEQDIADQRKTLKEDMDNYADQLQVDHKAVAAAYQALCMNVSLLTLQLMFVLGRKSFVMF